MKHIYFSILFIMVAWSSVFALHQPDTVIIKLSDVEEIKIISSSGNELRQLSKYDLNKIFQQLENEALDNSDDKVIIVLEDERGTKFLLNEDGDIEERNAEASSLELERKLQRLERELDRLNEDIDGERSDDAEKVNFSKKKHKGTSSSFTIEFGLNNYLTDGEFPDASNELYAVNPLTSWYVALGSMNSTHIAGPVSLDWGANVSWYNFKFDNVRTRVSKTDEGIVFSEDLSNEFEAIKSKIVVPYINVTLVPMFVLGKRRSSSWEPFSYHENDGFRIGVGAYAGYRIGGRSKFVIRDDGDRQRDKNKTNFYFNNWRYGARIQVGFKGVDLFANYDLNELFIEDRGPRLNSFSFGIIL